MRMYIRHNDLFLDIVGITIVIFILVFVAVLLGAVITVFFVFVAATVNDNAQNLGIGILNIFDG